MATRVPSERSRKRHRVLLVDSHPITRHGLAELINTEADLAVCGESTDVEQAVDAVQQRIAALCPAPGWGRTGCS